jgi:ribosomal protein S18 acetylase RimI-like enzyme
LMARRGWSSRGACMAVLPGARASGIGTWLLGRLLEESRGRGERRMELEVIEQNAPGVRLYEKSGFHTLRRLVSFSLSAADGGLGKENLEEVDVREVARAVTAYGLPDLPWQVSGETIAHLGPPHVAYKMDAACVVITDPSVSTVAIRSAIVEPRGRGQGQGTRLLRALMARHPGKEWKVNALCPEEMGGLFESVGFVKGRLTQLHMVNDLT